MNMSVIARRTLHPANTGPDRALSLLQLVALLHGDVVITKITRTQTNLNEIIGDTGVISFLPDRFVSSIICAVCIEFSSNQRRPTHCLSLFVLFFIIVFSEYLKIS